MSDEFGFIPSIYGPDESTHIRKPSMSFSPVNTNQSFVASPRKRTSGPKRLIETPTHSEIAINSSPQLFTTDWNGFRYFIATPEQKRAAERSHRARVNAS